MEATELTILDKPEVDAKALLKDLKGKQYLGAHEAIFWFTTEHPAPEGRIITHIDFEHSCVRAEIYIGDTLVATGHSIGDGSKSLEKLETGAVRRALANAGYGTVAAMAEDEDAARTEARAAMAGKDMSVEDAKKALGNGKPDKRRIPTDGLRGELMKKFEHPYYGNHEHLMNAIEILYKADILYDSIGYKTAAGLLASLANFRANGLEPGDAIAEVRKLANKPAS